MFQRRSRGNDVRDPPCRDRRGVFHSRAEWREFVAGNPDIKDQAFVARCAEHIARAGFDFLGEHIAPGQFEFVPPNYRETFVHRGISSRKRAVLRELFDDIERRGLADPAIYAPEALSGFAQLLGEKFARYRGSEFMPDERLQRKHPGIEHQDLSALTYPDAAFDYVLVNDVFEHVPDLSTVLAEIHRVLAPGGVLLSTFPFAFASTDHVVKARLEEGRIEYLREPEYHGDPLNPKGVLVFQVPGWAILDDCRRAGFRDAVMIFVISVANAVLASQPGGIMVLKAEK